MIHQTLLHVSYLIIGPAGLDQSNKNEVLQVTVFPVGTRVEKVVKIFRNRRFSGYGGNVGMCQDTPAVFSRICRYWIGRIVYINVNICWSREYVTVILVVAMIDRLCGMGGSSEREVA